MIPPKKILLVCIRVLAVIALIGIAVSDIIIDRQEVQTMEDGS